MIKTYVNKRGKVTIDNIKVAADIDECLADFMGGYKEFYQTDKNPHRLNGLNITKNVRKLRNNKEFWENLDLLDNGLDFNPEIYCTKRINPKSYTKNWLSKNKLPNVPIYQMYYYGGNKADMIKGLVDVLVDDSIDNVYKSIESGVPALILDTPYNQNGDPLFRIYSLNKDEIYEGYQMLLDMYNF